MPYKEEDFRNEGVKITAFLMAESARTAPKSKGEDDVEIVYLEGEELEKLAEKMEELGREEGRDRDFFRDADSVKKAQAALLVGVSGEKPIGVNCGACGFKGCSEFKRAERRGGKDFVGPSCVFKILDLGIALGSAAKVSAILGVDTRIMYRIGAAAKKLGFTKADVVMGIPISATGKSPFFDRKHPK